MGKGRGKRRKVKKGQGGSGLRDHHGCWQEGRWFVGLPKLLERRQDWGPVWTRQSFLDRLTECVVMDLDCERSKCFIHDSAVRAGTSLPQACVLAPSL